MALILIKNIRTDNLSADDSVTNQNAEINLQDIFDLYTKPHTETNNDLLLIKTLDGHEDDKPIGPLLDPLILPNHENNSEDENTKIDEETNDATVIVDVKETEVSDDKIVQEDIVLTVKDDEPSHDEKEIDVDIEVEEHHQEQHHDEVHEEAHEEAHEDPEVEEHKEEVHEELHENEKDIKEIEEHKEDVHNEINETTEVIEIDENKEDHEDIDELDKEKNDTSNEIEIEIVEDKSVKTDENTNVESGTEKPEGYERSRVVVNLRQQSHDYQDETRRPKPGSHCIGQCCLGGCRLYGHQSVVQLGS